MKYLLLYLFFFSSAFTLWSQKSPATLFFKDGTTKTGYVFGDTDWELKFSKQLKGKKTKYQFEELDSLRLTENYKENIYHIQKYKFGKNQTKLTNLKYAKVELITDGPVQLYIMKTSHIEAGGTTFSYGHNGSITTTVTSGGGYTQYSLFVKKPEEERLFWLYTKGIVLRNFKKASKEYFKDCPELISRIEAGDYTRSNAIAMVNFYNDSCSQK
jgi:hypothetical protein